MNLDNLGGRKFLLTLIVIAVGSVVQVLSKNGIGEAYTALLLGAVTAYGATNAIITTRALGVGGPAPAASDDGSGSDDGAPAAPAPTVDLAPLQEKVALLQAALDDQSQAISTLQVATANNQKLVQALLPRP